MQVVADAVMPERPGVYIVWADAQDRSPLYVGVAARQTLRQRWAGNHLSSRSGSSALRRSLALYLDLVESKLKQPERRHPQAVERSISEYLRRCLVRLYPTETGEEALVLERLLITELDPQLNVARPSPLSTEEPPHPMLSIERLLGRERALAEPSRAASQCRIATGKLLEQLAGDGLSAEMVWVRHPAINLCRAEPRALAADVHALVRLRDGRLVDITRRQFDPLAPLPQIYSDEAELATHWREVNDDDWRAPWRTLDKA